MTHPSALSCALRNPVLRGRVLMLCAVSVAALAGWIPVAVLGLLALAALGLGVLELSAVRRSRARAGIGLRTDQIDTAA
jgi:hypothetical protein